MENDRLAGFLSQGGKNFEMLGAAEQSLTMPKAFCRFQFDLRSFIIVFPT